MADYTIASSVNIEKGNKMRNIVSNSLYRLTTNQHGKGFRRSRISRGIDIEKNGQCGRYCL